MAHIPVPENMPGIRGLMAFRPETALPLNMLAELAAKDFELGLLTQATVAVYTLADMRLQRLCLLRTLG